MKRPDPIVCRCEEVTLRELRDGLALGGGDARTLKLSTRAGMGACQGRECRHLLARVANGAAGGAPRHDMLTVRPPVRLTPASFFAMEGDKGRQQRAPSPIRAESARPNQPSGAAPGAASQAVAGAASQSAARIDDHPILGRSEERRVVTFTFDGREVTGLEGEPIAAALLAAGIRQLRRAERSGEPRGVFCGIGHCYECRVTVDGQRSVRSCLTPLREGMAVQSQEPIQGGSLDGRGEPDEG